MNKKFLSDHQDKQPIGNVYANKSALVIWWLLTKGVHAKTFSLREISKNLGVSIGLVQKVFSVLIWKGLLHTTGIRTSKEFCVKEPKKLLSDWISNYDITKKCKMKTYSSTFSSKNELLKRLESSHISKEVSLALHSAADFINCSNNNLNTLELYHDDPAVVKEVEQVLELMPKERGYDVLLVQPYYKAILQTFCIKQGNLKASPPLLTYLDLYHYPLRGIEQAEGLEERIPEISQLLE